MSVTLGILAVVAGAPALYVLFMAWSALRLAVFARELRRECASHDWKLEWSLFLLFPSDFEDPITLDVVLHRNGRRLSFTVFRSLLANWQPLRITLQPLAFADRIRGRMFLDPKGKESGVVEYLLREGRAEALEIGDVEMDARYRLCGEKGGANAEENLAVLRAAFAHAGVRKQLEACGDGLTFDNGRLQVVRDSRRDRDFLVWIDSVARLADTLDDLAKVSGPYR